MKKIFFSFVAATFLFIAAIGAQENQPASKTQETNPTQVNAPAKSSAKTAHKPEKKSVKTRSGSIKRQKSKIRK